MNGSNGTVFLNGAQSSVVGASNTITIQSGAQNTVSLYSTGSTYDVFTGSGGTAILYSSKASLTGGGNRIDLDGSASDTASLYGTAGNAATLTGTAGNFDAVNGSGGRVNLNSAQAGITGNDDTLNLQGTNTVAVSGTSDAFVFQAAIGQDTISGFGATDTMQFAASDFTNWAALLSHTSQSGANIVITLNASDAVTLAGVAASSLTQGQFRFV